MPRSATTRVLVWLGVLFLAVLIMVGGSALVWQARTVTGLQNQVASLSGEKGQLLRRIDDLTRAQTAIPIEAPPAAVAAAPARMKGAATAEALLASEQQEVQRLRDTVAKSSTEVAELQTKVADLETRAGAIAEENRRLAAVVEEGRKNVEEARQEMETLRAQVKADAGRVADLENLNSKLKEEAYSRMQSFAQTQQTANDLQSIFHRREMYLNNILRRYKDITEQYRAMSGVRDGRDRESGPGAGAEISRIQNSIALTEEDLKQISALNAQAERLQKKFLAK